MSTTTVLVTAAEQRSALAIVRSLGRAGYRVFTCGDRVPALAAASRFSSGFSRVPSPITQAPAYVEAVRKLALRWCADFIIPVTDASNLALLPTRDTFGRTRVLGPPADAFHVVSNKDRLMQAARDVGLVTPGGMRLARPYDRFHLRPEQIPVPTVIKPARSLRGGRRHEVLHARTFEKLRTLLDALPAEAYPVLLQPRVVGPGIGVFVLRWRDQTLAAFSHRRLREDPPSGGASTLCESVPIDPALLERTEALLARVRWEGVAMAEFKVHSATGVPHLMEINGRFWGSLQLAIDAGVDFPALLLAAALGRPVQPVRDYQVGVRLRSLWRDVDVLLARLRHSRQALDLLPEAPGRVDALRSLVVPDPRARLETWRRQDLFPFLRDTGTWLKRRLGFALGGNRRNVG